MNGYMYGGSAQQTFTPFSTMGQSSVAQAALSEKLGSQGMLDSKAKR